MAVYSLNGQQLGSINNMHGELISIAYDLDAVVVYQSEIPWIDEISIQKLRDTNSNTYYYSIRIPQKRSNGAKQYPFVYSPNGAGAGLQSTLAMNREKKYKLAINAGVFKTGNIPLGIIIENGILIQQGSSSLYALTIGNDGLLNYAIPNTDGQTLISDGIISAVVGFFPLIIEHNGVDASIYTLSDSYNVPAQRQIIGQYDNGDYAIITCEGRNYDNSTGWTLPQAINILENIGLRFAYNLDGGGSTETVIGNDQINTIYEGSTGRIVPTYIVFNGTDAFEIPN